MESFVDLFQDWPLQSYSLLCCNGKTISTRFRRITSHSKIATNDEPCCQDAIARIVFNFSKPGEGDITGVKIHGVQLLKRTDRSDLMKAQIFLKSPIITTMSNSWKASLQQGIQNWMTTVLGLLKSGKTETTTYDRSGRPDKTSCRMVRQVRPDHGQNSSRRNRAIRKVRRSTS